MFFFFAQGFSTCQTGAAGKDNMETTMYVKVCKILLLRCSSALIRVHLNIYFVIQSVILTLKSFSVLFHKNLPLRLAVHVFHKQKWVHLTKSLLKMSTLSASKQVLIHLKTNMVKCWANIINPRLMTQKNQQTNREEQALTLISEVDLSEEEEQLLTVQPFLVQKQTSAHTEKAKP